LSSAYARARSTITTSSHAEACRASRFRCRRSYARRAAGHGGKCHSLSTLRNRSADEQHR
jgi:hypothetical protein